jgi:hypothetical protein
MNLLTMNTYHRAGPRQHDEPEKAQPNPVRRASLADPLRKRTLTKTYSHKCIMVFFKRELSTGGDKKKKKKKKELSACRGEGSAVGLQLRVRFVPAARCWLC